MTESTRRLLRERVPAALAEAGRVARDPDAPLARRAAQEQQLRELIVQLGRAHHGAAPTGLRTTEWEAPACTAEGGIEATAPMAFCPESVLIVHAPIMLARLYALAQRLLPAGTVPVAFERVRIRRPVTCDLLLRISPPGAAAADDAALSGRLHDSAGGIWHFSGSPLAHRPVQRWIDNREVGARFHIEPAPDAPVRHFRLHTRPGGVPTGAEALQLLLEAVIRAVVIHRNRDGRGILLAGIRHLAWPADLPRHLADGAGAEVRARPGKRLQADSPWHRLTVSHDGDLGEGRFDYVEAHTSLAALFA